MQDREVEHWEDSPEEFHHQSDSAAFRDNVRPCAELLFATLLQVSLLFQLLPPIHRLHPHACHGHLLMLLLLLLLPLLLPLIQQYHISFLTTDQAGICQSCLH